MSHKICKGCGKPVTSPRNETYCSKLCGSRANITKYNDSEEHDEISSRTMTRTWRAKRTEMLEDVRRCAKERGWIGGVSAARAAAKRGLELHPTLLSDNGKKTHRLHPKLYEKGLKDLIKFAQSPEGRKQISQQVRKRHQNPAESAKMVKPLLLSKFNRPTGLEKRVIQLIRRNNLPYDYVGNGVLNIGGKYPDFAHKSQNIVVEVADKQEKEFRRGYSWKRYENERVRHFNSHGYKCIVLWSDVPDNVLVTALTQD